MKQAFAGRLIEHLVRTLPPRRVYAIASGLSYAFLRGKTERLLADTQSLFPDRSDTWVRDVVRRQRHHRAWVAVDKYMLTRLSGEQVVGMHAPADLKHISTLAEEMLASGNGGIVYTLHYGRPAWSPFLLTELGFPYVGLMRGDSETGLQQRHTAAARAKGVKLVEAGDLASGVHALRGLKENKLIFLLIDGQMAQRTTTVEFLGRRVPLSLGFAQLARRTGARLLAGVTYTAGDPLHFGIRAQLVDLPGADASEEELARALVAPLERMVLEDVGQWYGINRLFRQARRLERAAFEPPDGSTDV